MKNVRSCYDGRTYLVHINSFHNQLPAGRYYNVCGEDEGQFQSMAQLIFQLEQSLNTESDFRQIHKVRALYPTAGHVATFSIQISFRRNASWQGTILWMETKITKTFRSVLELMMLIHDALNETVQSQWMEFKDRVSNS